MYTLGNARNLDSHNEMLRKYAASVTELPLKKTNYTGIPEISRQH